MFLEYYLQSDALIVGERIKAGIFRPSCRTIPYSQITGALKSSLGSENVHAVGVLDDYRTDYLIYSPQERVTRRSKIPITTEILTRVNGRVYIVKNDSSEKSTQKVFEVSMGGLRMKGFGVCRLEFKREIVEPKVQRGILATRIPCNHLNMFMIQNVIRPVYGYLFKPTSDASGVYVKSLFDGSEVVGPEVLLKEVIHNG